MEITRYIGEDKSTGLGKRLRVRNFVVDLEKNVISVNCIIELMSPTGVVVKHLSEFPYYREDNPEVLDSDGKQIFPEKTEFSQLADSDIGRQIVAMLQKDIDSIDGDVLS